MKKIILCLVLILPLFGCSSKSIKTYTVEAGNTYRTVIGYGTVICESIVNAEIPKNASDIALLFNVGDKINKGDCIASYKWLGNMHKITAQTDGIIKRIEKDAIFYYDMSNLQILVKISESDIADISVGLNAMITGSGFKGNYYNGEIVRISSAVERTSAGAYADCYIKVLNPDLSMIPSFSARVEIKVLSDNQVMIPIDSIGYDGEFYVNKITNGDSERVKIISGKVCGDLCEVSGGIKSGDIISIKEKGD